MSSPDPPEPAAPADVAAILADVRAEIRQRRAHLAVHGPGDTHALNLAELRRSVEAVNELWFVSAHLPITWQIRILGRLGAYTKRVVRLMLRWYITPIVEQQDRFNAATARAITVLNVYQERMTREWMLLEERIARLEEAPAAPPDTAAGGPAAPGA